MMRTKLLWVTLLAHASLPAAAASSNNRPPDVKTFTALTKPLELLPGEVTNSFHSLQIPPGPIAVYGFAAEVVEKDEQGNIVSVPSFDAYLHHHVVASKHESYEHMKDTRSPMKPKGVFRSVGFGAGTESRGTPQNFAFPFAFTTVPGEDEWVANVHVINTRGMEEVDAHHCLECPCKSSDVFLEGTVNFSPLPWDNCNDDLVSEENTACSADTYIGGLRCCEDREFCLEEDELEDSSSTSTYYLQYTLTYADIVPENRQLGLAACCDASGDISKAGNIEYDIPKCDRATNPDCIHTLSTVQELHGMAQGPFVYHAVEDEDKDVDVVYMVGHMHRGGIDLSLYDDTTDELICTSKPTYGTGDTVLDEKGYIVSMSTCTFDPPRRMRTSDRLRVVARYDSSEAHTGVMSLFYIAMADATEATPLKNEALSMEESIIGPEIQSSFPTIFVMGGVVVVALLATVATMRSRSPARTGYSPVSETTVLVV